MEGSHLNMKEKAMVRKEETVDNWLTSEQAAEILTARSGHTVTSAYVRRLGNPKALAKIAIWQVNKRTRLYSRRDIEEYTVKVRGDGSVRREARRPRRKQSETDAA